MLGRASDHQYTGFPVFERQIDQRARIYGRANKRHVVASPTAAAATTVQYPPNEQSAQRGNIQQRQAGEFFILSIEGSDLKLRANLCHTG